MSPIGLQVQQEGDNDARNSLVPKLAWTCTQAQITLLPMSQRGCQSLRSCCLQRIKHKGGNNSGATERKVKAVKVNDVNYGGNIDRGVITFSSDVSLSQDDKQLCWVNKLQLSN